MPSLNSALESIHLFGLQFISFPLIFRIILFLVVECCWNVYPSTAYSSLLLLFVHLCILFGIWFSPAEYPYIISKGT
jgi:alpha-1,3-mannosyltransferase